MDASRFDALTRSLAARPSRRRLIKALAALGLGGALLRPAARTSARVSGCPEVKCTAINECVSCLVDENDRCWCTCEDCWGLGIAGGGAVRTATGGEAHLALLATRSSDPNRPGAFTVQGQVRWTDSAWEGAGLTLESTTVTYYAPLPDVEGGREAAGWLRTDQHPDAYPFVLRAIDAGPPGGGQDTVALWVGDAVLEDAAVAGTPAPELEPTGFRYVAEGTLVSGDLQLVRLASPAAALATPTP